MTRSRIEVWAGVECTVNRVGDVYHNQCDRNGHSHREEDLNLFADLGIKKIRQPVIWEIAQGDRPEGDYDFSWARSRLERLKELGIEPIAGLVHHGSGPRYTSLADPRFPERLAHYAQAVAKEFPYLEYYTPVNEILTTARFSGLYGIWYPHGTDNRTFLTCLFNEIKGTVLAMREIRKVNPQAKLVQTDDLGRCQGTDLCLEQVGFENERRWLGFDLLMGKVTPEHALWPLLREFGATEEELNWFIDHPCPPDVIGVNHYLLSNRFLDERIELYPECFRGGNGQIRYADVGVIQAYELGIPEPRPRFITPEEVLRDVVTRYPDTEVAVTEVHINGSRESQMHWLKEVAEAAQKLRDEGAKVRAITAWSLLGAFDWNSLCRDDRGYYETGVFDIRGAQPRPTGIAHALRQLAKNGSIEHPVLTDKGWWHYASGLLPKSSASSPRVLITGATGTLGRAFARVAAQRGLNHTLVSRAEMDIASIESVRRALDTIKPWIVVNTAGYVRVDDAESERDRAFRENVVGSEILAQECRRRGVLYVTFSSDLVFGSRSEGDSRRPFLETDSISPLNVYGLSKAEMEKRVMAIHPDAMVVRTSSFFGPWDQHNFVVRTLRQLRAGEKVVAPENIVMSPTFVPDLVNACYDLALDGLRDVVHLNNVGEISWADLARMTARKFGMDETLIEGTCWSRMGFTAPRPTYSAMSSHRVKVMPGLEDALDRHHFESKNQETTP